MFVLMIIEGPVITFTWAFLASFGIFNIWIVLLLGWMWDIFWDALFYGIGRFWLWIFKKKTAIDTPKEVSAIGKLDHIIHTNLSLAILIVKFTPYLPPIGLTYMGRIRVNFEKYFLYSTLLCVPIPLVTALVWFHIGYLNELFKRYSGTTLLLYVSWSVAIILIALWTVLFLRKESENILEKQEVTFDEVVKNTESDTKV